MGSESTKVWTLGDHNCCIEKEKERLEQRVHEQDQEIKRMQGHIDQIQERNNQLETAFKESQDR